MFCFVLFCYFILLVFGFAFGVLFGGIEVWRVARVKGKCEHDIGWEGSVRSWGGERMSSKYTV